MTELIRTDIDQLFRPGNGLLVAGSRLYRAKHHMAKSPPYDVTLSLTGMFRPFVGSADMASVSQALLAAHSYCPMRGSDGRKSGPVHALQSLDPITCYTEIRLGLSGVELRIGRAVRPV